MDKEVKMTFGLTDKHIKAIEDKINYWDSIYSSQKNNEIKAINQRHVWTSIGEEIGWEPLTALLYYLRHKENEVEQLKIESYNSALREAVKKVSAFKFRGLTEEHIIEEVQESILEMQKKK